MCVSMQITKSLLKYNARGSVSLSQGGCPGRAESRDVFVCVFCVSLPCRNGPMSSVQVRAKAHMVSFFSPSQRHADQVSIRIKKIKFDDKRNKRTRIYLVPHHKIGRFNIPETRPERQQGQSQWNDGGVVFLIEGDVLLVIKQKGKERNGLINCVSKENFLKRRFF